MINDFEFWGYLVMWGCPICGYIILNIEYTHVRVDPECPGCNARNLSEFDLIAGVNNEQTESW